MSKNRCPECGSSSIQTERRPDGFHHCMYCRHSWKIGASQPKPTVFHQITQSPEVLAPVFVGMMYNRICGNYLNYSMLTGEWYATHAEALSATVAELKKVVK